MTEVEEDVRVEEWFSKSHTSNPVSKIDLELPNRVFGKNAKEITV